MSASADEPQLTCPKCGAPLQRGGHVAGQCLVCLLELALDEEEVPIESAERFDHYKVATRVDGTPVELGRGAMGVTYKALDTVLGRAVALKVIAVPLAARPETRERFLREARAAARLHHPNVASVFYYGVRPADGQCFYAMELVKGETLAARLRRAGPLAAAEALEIVTQVALALGAAEAQGVVHRDLKPSNLMLAEGPQPVVKVIDFGLAKAVADAEESTLTCGGFVGTPAYASPEQFAGLPVDIRSDLYSLGVTLWQMLTGQVLFRGSPAELMHQHLHGALPLKELEHVPCPLVSLVTALLHKDPAHRPQDPSKLRTVLQEVKAALETDQVKPRSVLRGAAEPKGGQVLYQDELDRMCVEMQPVPCRATPHHSSRLFAQVWDFTPFLVAKRKAFSGRQWLFQQIDEWRTKGSQPALLIIGEPGIGKSSIVAALVHDNPHGQVLAYHCCRADTPATLEPAGFVRSLAAQLAAQRGDYAAMFDQSVILAALHSAEADPVSAFERGILGPLHRLLPPKQSRPYLLIDALDEALTRTQRPTIVDVLSMRLDLLPSWLRIVATTRNEPNVLRHLGGLRALTLNAQDPRNQDDVRCFIEQRLSEPELREKALAHAGGPTELATTLSRSSAGNFLFITTVLDAIEAEQLSFGQIEKLPPGLGCLYELFFNRLFRDAGVDFRAWRPVLEIMAGASELLSREQIAAAIGLDAVEELVPLLARLGSFVPVCEGRYAFFHRSLFDWLTGWDPRQDQPLAGPYHVSLKKGRTRLADWCWTAYKHGPSKMPLYCIRHLPSHLYQTGRAHEAGTVLLDFKYLRTKLEATGASALIADYEYFLNEPDLWLVRSALQLSAHVLARDHRELAGQLTGRLLSTARPNLQAWLQHTAETNDRVWLRPLTPSLTQAGGPLIRTLEGHARWVSAIAVTPDGRRAVSASHDRTLRVWDLASGESVRTLEGHANQVHAVAITLDGHYAVSAADDYTLRIWDLESGQSVRTLGGHTARIGAVALTPDGRRAVSASHDRTLRVWDLGNGQTVHRLEGHTNVVTAVALTPDGRRAVSGSADHTLRVWDLESSQSVRTLEGHADGVTAVAVTPDGRRAVSGSADHTLRVWDLEVGQSVCTLEGHTDGITAVMLTPDGRSAALTSDYHTLRVWDLESGQSLCILEGHTDWVTAVAVTPDGRRAVSGSADHTLRVWDLEAGQSVCALEGHADVVTAVAISPLGCRVVSAAGDGTLRVWDLGTARSVRTLEGYGDWVTALAMSSDGRFAVSGSNLGMLRVWDLEGSGAVRTLPGHTDWVTAVTVTPDGRRAVSAANDCKASVWDLESSRSPRTLEGHTDRISAVAVMPNSRRAISASHDHTLRVWDLESGEYIAGFTAEGPLLRFALSPEGRTIIAQGKSWRNYLLRLEEVDNGDMVGGRNITAPFQISTAAPVGDNANLFRVNQNILPAAS